MIKELIDGLMNELELQCENDFSLPSIDGLMEGSWQPLCNGWWVDLLIFNRHQEAAITRHDVVLHRQSPAWVGFHEVVQKIYIQIKSFTL